MNPPAPAGTPPPMHVEPYQTCQDCGATLQSTTVYRRHARCVECRRLAG